MRKSTIFECKETGWKGWKHSVIRCDRAGSRRIEERRVRRQLESVKRLAQDF